MDLKLVFRISAVIKVINGLGLLLMTSTFIAMANITPTPDLITLGQFMGVTFLFIAIVEWRIPDIAGDSTSSLGQLWAIGNVLWFLIAGYHIMTGQAGGSTGYINVALFAVFAVLFYMKSRKSE